MLGDRHGGQAEKKYRIPFEGSEERGFFGSLERPRGVPGEVADRGPTEVS